MLANTELYQALSSDLFPDSIKVNDALMAKTKEFLFETKKKLKLKGD